MANHKRRGSGNANTPHGKSAAGEGRAERPHQQIAPDAHVPLERSIGRGQQGRSSVGRGDARRPPPSPGRYRSHSQASFEQRRPAHERFPSTERRAGDGARTAARSPSTGSQRQRSSNYHVDAPRVNGTPHRGGGGFRRGGWRVMRGRPHNGAAHSPSQQLFPGPQTSFEGEVVGGNTPSDQQSSGGTRRGRGSRRSSYRHRRRPRTHSVGVGTAPSDDEDRSHFAPKPRLDPADLESRSGASVQTASTTTVALRMLADPAEPAPCRQRSYTPMNSSSEDEGPKRTDRRRPNMSLDQSAGGVLKATLILSQQVHWTDGTTTTLRTLRELLYGAQPILLEADTPVVSPSKPALFPGTHEALFLPCAMTVDSVATPNTFKLLHPAHLPPPIAVPPVTLNMFEFLMVDYNPRTNSFGWRTSVEGKANFFEGVLGLVSCALAELRPRPLLRHVNAPAYVLGDIHGNFADLYFFVKSMLGFGDIRLTTNNILCLGDYVDRGEHSIECLVVLLGLMVIDPEKVTLLRGNHEDRVVCGDKSTYGATCLFGQCTTEYGEADGRRLFAALTSVFRHLPLAAMLKSEGGRALCTHGGFPRFTSNPLEDNQLAALASPSFPRFLTLFPNNPIARMQPEDAALEDGDTGYPASGLTETQQQRFWYTTFDLMWADPTAEDEDIVVDEWGFGRSNRGQAVVSFTAKAVETFLNAHHCDMLFRAHQEKAHGIRLSKSSRVLTIFSSSNYLGHGNGAGCAVVATDGQVKLVVKAGEEMSRSDSY